MQESSRILLGHIVLLKVIYYYITSAERRRHAFKKSRDRTEAPPSKLSARLQNPKVPKNNEIIKTLKNR